MKTVHTGITHPSGIETTYAKDQPQYIALPGFKQRDGTFITRWQLTWRERLTLLLRGELWLQVLTFNQPLQPVKLSVEQPEIRPIPLPFEMEAQQQAQLSKATEPSQSSIPGLPRVEGLYGTNRKI